MNNETYIPSNFTLDDVIRYVRIPEEVRQLLESAAKRINYLDAELKHEYKRVEIAEEQLVFCRGYIWQIQVGAKKATNVKDLKKFIEVTLENSSIEL